MQGKNMVGDETDRAKEMTQTDASTDSVTDRPFRYRMRDLLRSSAWDGGRAVIDVETIYIVNGDLQSPRRSVRLMMEARGFTIEAHPTHWVVSHPAVNESNWQDQLYNF
jgi:hypothetical protein